MILDRESFDFKYISHEIMANLSLAQDDPTVFTIQGTFSCLLYFLAKLLSCTIILHVLSSVHISRITLLLKQILLNSDLAQHFVGPD